MDGSSEDHLQYALALTLLTCLVRSKCWNCDLTSHVVLWGFSDSTVQSSEQVTTQIITRLLGSTESFQNMFNFAIADLFQLFGAVLYGGSSLHDVLRMCPPNYLLLDKASYCLYFLGL